MSSYIPSVPNVSLLGVKEEPGEPLGLFFWICVSWISLNLIGAIFANVLPLQNPLYENFNAINAGPGLHHLMGTDDLGRDILARVVYGSRVSITVGSTKSADELGGAA